MKNILSAFTLFIVITTIPVVSAQELKPFYKYNKFGFVDSIGTEIIPPIYDEFHFCKGFILVSENNKWGIIDKNGTEIIYPKYDKNPMYELSDGINSSLSEGYFVVYLNGKWGFVDTTGTEIIYPKYDNVSPFSEGLANVTLDNKTGYIDKTDKQIIPFKYDQAYPFFEGYAMVKLNDKWGFINKDGYEIQDKRSLPHRSANVCDFAALQRKFVIYTFNLSGFCLVSQNRNTIIASSETE